MTRRVRWSIWSVSNILTESGRISLSRIVEQPVIGAELWEVTRLTVLGRMPSPQGEDLVSFLAPKSRSRDSAIRSHRSGHDPPCITSPSVIKPEHAQRATLLVCFETVVQIQTSRRSSLRISIMPKCPTFLIQFVTIVFIDKKCLVGILEVIFSVESIFVRKIQWIPGALHLRRRVPLGGRASCHLLDVFEAAIIPMGRSYTKRIDLTTPGHGVIEWSAVCQGHGQ